MGMHPKMIEALGSKRLTRKQRKRSRQRIGGALMLRHTAYEYFEPTPDSEG